MPTKADVLAILARRGVDIGALGQSTTAAKPTEDQGKNLGYAKDMAGAEQSYQRAVQEGYNPASIRNSTAAVFEGLPFGGLDGLGALVRDPVSDRARQAELQWSDARLKAVSGAASPESEVKRGVKTYFSRPNEQFADIEPQKAAARRTAFESSRIRSGPLQTQAGLYPSEQGASLDNPLDLSDGRSRSDLAIGAYYRDPQGNIRRNDNGDRGNPIFTPAQKKAAANAQLKAKSAAKGGFKLLGYE